MYRGMKVRVDNVIERSKVDGEYITGEGESQVFSKWKDGFIRQDHPTIIQVHVYSLNSSSDQRFYIYI